MTIIDIYRPDQWHDFFVLVGTGAAALTGLLFVAMSLHFDIVVKNSFLMHRALSILIGLSADFILCALILMGGQNHVAIGFEILLIFSIVTFAGTNSFIQALKQNKKIPRDSLYRTIGSMCCDLMGIFGAIIFIYGSISGLYIAALGITSGFYFLISGSWLLLVGISRDTKNKLRK